MDRSELANARRVVVKVGATAVAERSRKGSTGMRPIVDDLVAVVRRGVDVVVVSSGAVIRGMEALGLRERPRDLAALQATAAVGQSRLMRGYEEAFGSHRINVAQVLLTAEDVADRRRYLNVRNTVLALLDLGVVPVVNENDTVAVDELRVGDNDSLSALVAAAVDADLLILLAGAEGLPGGEAGGIAPIVEAVTPAVERMARRAPGKGLESKVRAARIAARSGIPMALVHHAADRPCQRVLDGEELGTLFLPQERLEGRLHWLLFSSRPKGTVRVDEGARRALAGGSASLLPSGVTAVEGSFRRGDTVSIAGPDGEEFARGISNHTSRDAARIAGLRSDEAERVLGPGGPRELVHSANLVVV